MNKTNLINEVAKVIGSKKDAKDVLECIITSIKDTLCNKENISITNFAIFKVIEKKARKGINPQNGEEITIAARNVIKFIPAKALKEALKNNKNI